MKPSILLSLLLLFTSLSCKKDDTNVQAQNNGLVGKWKMVAQLLDTGNGKPQFVEATEGFSSVIEFKSNGDFKEQKGFLYSYINPFDTYKILDNKKIQLSVTKSTAQVPPFEWQYQDLTATTVTLSFGCDKPCMGKYVAIK